MLPENAKQNSQDLRELTQPGLADYEDEDYADLVDHAPTTLAADKLPDAGFLNCASSSRAVRPPPLTRRRAQPSRTCATRATSPPRSSRAMAAEAAPGEGAEDKGSLLILLLDTHPGVWDAPAPPRGAEQGCALELGYAAFAEQVCVFVNAFLLLHPQNRLAALALHCDAVHLLYESPELRARGGEATPAAAALLCALGRLPSPDALPPSALLRTSPLSGALSRALCYLQRAQRGAAGAAALAPRILALSGGSDTAGQYVPMMNAIFAAQSAGVPLDACLLGAGESAYLQQAASLTGGLYLRPPRPAALLQYLLSVFAVDPAARAQLRLPQSRGVDFRASCFCHKRPVDVGLVCSVCLSIYCADCAACSTCGADYNEGVA